MCQVLAISVILLWLLVATGTVKNVLYGNLFQAPRCISRIKFHKAIIWLLAACHSNDCPHRAGPVHLFKVVMCEIVTFWHVELSWSTAVVDTIPCYLDGVFTFYRTVVVITTAYSRKRILYTNLVRLQEQHDSATCLRAQTKVAIADVHHFGLGGDLLVA
jgi:hypothetical protein